MRKLRPPLSGNAAGLWPALFLLASLATHFLGAQTTVKKYHLALIVPNDGSYYWQAAHAGAIKAQQEYAKKDIQIEILWLTPKTPNDLNEQINLAGDAVGGGMDGIGLAPLDPHALIPPIELAIRAKIPVVTMEYSMDYPLITSSVATNNFRCGTEAAVVTGKLLNNRGRVLVIRHEHSDPISTKRENGFLDGVRKYSDTLEVLSPDDYAGKTEQDAYTLTQKFLKLYGTQIAAIFTATNETTLGAHRALKESGLSDRIKQIGFMDGEAGLAAIKAGDLQGLISPDPFNLGFLTVNALMETLKGRFVSPRVEVPNATVTIDNMNDPAVQSILCPPIQDYLPKTVH